MDFDILFIQGVVEVGTIDAGAVYAPSSHIESFLSCIADSCGTASQSRYSLHRSDLPVLIENASLEGAMQRCGTSPT
jgi:hypothetical protein